MTQDYTDIIDLPYPRDDWNFLMKHPRMSMESRAKIFAPFAALRGHSTALAKTAEQKDEEFQNQIMKEEKEYIEKQEILDAIRDGLLEIKRRRQNGEEGITLQQLIDEL